MEAITLAARGKKKQTGYLDENRDYAPATIENPYQPGTYEGVVVNKRESNARTLRLGPAQAEAYNRVWALYYKAGYHRQGAVDPSNEPVDCSRSADPFPLSVAQANAELNRLRSAVGNDWWLFIELTCKHGHDCKDIARIKLYREPSRADMDVTRWQVKEAWNKVAFEMNLTGTSTWFARLQAHTEGERPSINTACWESEE